MWYPYTMELWLSIKKEWNLAICCNMDRPKDDHTMWSSLIEKEGQVSWYRLYHHHIRHSVTSDPLWSDHNGLPGSSVHVILQARILEWVASSFSRGPSQCRGQSQVFHTASRFFTIWAITYMWNVKNKTKQNKKELIYKTEIDSQM